MTSWRSFGFPPPSNLDISVRSCNRALEKERKKEKTHISSFYDVRLGTYLKQFVGLEVVTICRTMAFRFRTI